MRGRRARNRTEATEHLLLASGEGHHHHAGDEVTDVFGCVTPFPYFRVDATSNIDFLTDRIDFPPLLLGTILLSLVVSAIGFDNHAKIVSSTYTLCLCGITGLRE